MELSKELLALIGIIVSSIVGWQGKRWADRLTQAKILETEAKTRKIDQNSLHAAINNIQHLSERLEMAEKHVEECRSEKAEVMQIVTALREDVHSKQRDVVKLQSELDALQEELVRRREQMLKRQKLVDHNSEMLTKRVLADGETITKLSQELRETKEWRLDHCRTVHGSTEG